MYCINDNRDRSKTVTLTFLREELLYDISNIAFVTGDVMKKESEHESHQVQDIAEDGNVDRVTRILDLGVAHCREALFPYSKVPVCPHTYKDDTLREPDSYVIDLRVPSDFSKTTAEYLEKLIHELLVAWVLADWFGITYPEKAEWWGAKASALEDEIKGALARSCGYVYRRRSPFDSGSVR
jgi:hypothetical protein